jgi:cephalosporin-C deacetylase-like acetyl esterase/pimeloyl-ACP methyl ester carboxylesterase
MVNRRVLLVGTAALSALLVSAAPLPAQEDLTVLKPEPGKTPPGKMLYEQQRAEAGRYFDARRKEVAKLKTPEDVRKRQADLRAKFIASLGGFPEKTPLNARVTGTVHGEGFRVEKVIFESRPDHHVTGALFIPDGKGPFPGVLVPCGHSQNGKAAETYQRASILLAMNGLVAFCYDPIGQGERFQLLNAEGKPAVGGNTTEHSLVGVGALLVGRQTASFRIWDGIRAMDYLAGRPEVDPRRLGCTGNSGGGTLTAYLMALDERILAAAPSCYITTLEQLFATIGPQDAEQNITGQVAFGMEHTDYVTMRAPRPTLICVGTQDYFDINGAWTTYREAKLLYGVLGFGERVDLFEYNDKHGFSRPRRQAACGWMLRWLAGKDAPVAEPDFPIFKDADLQCTKSGQVLIDFKNGRSVVDINGQRADELAAERAKAGRSGADLLIAVRAAIGLAPDRGKGRATVLPEAVTRDGYVIRKTVFETEPGIRVPGLTFEPARERPTTPRFLYLPGEPMAAVAGAGGPPARSAREGHRVLAVDLRGWGETAPGAASPKRPDYLGADWREAFLGLHLDRPLLGRRVADVSAVLDDYAGPTGIHIIAVGVGGPVGLHAAALDGRVKSLTLERCILSWTAVVKHPAPLNQLSNAVPGALAVYDLPELAATLAPRPLTIRNAVDPAGRPVSQEELERVYAPARAAYVKAGAEAALVLQAGR